MKLSAIVTEILQFVCIGLFSCCTWYVSERTGVISHCHSFSRVCTVPSRSSALTSPSACNSRRWLQWQVSGWHEGALWCSRGTSMWCRRYCSRIVHVQWHSRWSILPYPSPPAAEAAADDDNHHFAVALSQQSLSWSRFWRHGLWKSPAIHDMHLRDIFEVNPVNCQIEIVQNILLAIISLKTAVFHHSVL